MRRRARYWWPFASVTLTDRLVGDASLRVDHDPPSRWSLDLVAVGDRDRRPRDRRRDTRCPEARRAQGDPGIARAGAPAPAGRAPLSVGMPGRAEDRVAVARRRGRSRPPRPRSRCMRTSVEAAPGPLGSRHVARLGCRRPSSGSLAAVRIRRRRTASRPVVVIRSLTAIPVGAHHDVVLHRVVLVRGELAALADHADAAGVPGDGVLADLRAVRRAGQDAGAPAPVAALAKPLFQTALSAMPRARS